MYSKASKLKNAEFEMNKRFDVAKDTLLEYREKFQKNKKDLQQDHDSFV